MEYLIYAIVGVSIGVLSAVFGVGGGFILVPLLMGVLGMEVHAAVGNSLGILFVSSIYAAALYAFDSKVNYLIAGVLMVSAYGGSRYGMRLLNQCKGKTLTRYFSVLLFLSTGGIIARQLGFAGLGLYYSVIVTALFALYVMHRFRGATGEE